MNTAERYAKAQAEREANLLQKQKEDAHKAAVAKAAGIDTAGRYKKAMEAAAKAQGIEEMPSWPVRAVNAVGRWLGEVPSEGDLSPNFGIPNTPLGPMVNALLAPSFNAIAAVDTLQNRDERVGEVAGSTGLARSVLDGLSVGTMNHVGALADMVNEPTDPTERLSRIWQLQTNEPMEVYSQRVEERDMREEITRAGAPVSSVVGDVLGALGPGLGATKLAFGALAKQGGNAAKYMAGTTFGRLLTGSAVGSGQAAAYRMNKGGELEEIATDAGVAFLGGMVLGGTFSALKGGYNRLMNIVPDDVAQFSIGEKMITAINADRTRKGLGALTSKELGAELQKLGPDATLMDLLPGLGDYAASIQASRPAGEAAQIFNDFVGTRASMAEDLLAPDGTLRSVFGAENIRSLGEVSRSLPQRFANVRPSFDAAEKAHEGVTFSPDTIRNNLQKMFGPKANWTQEQRSLVKAIRNKIDAALDFSMTPAQKAAQAKLAADAAKASAKGGAVYTPKSLVDLSLRQMINLKQNLQDAIGKKVITKARSDKPIPLNNQSIRDLTRVTGMLSDMLNTSAEQLRVPNAVYGNLASARTAYKAGMKAFKSIDTDDSDVIAFMADENKSALQKRMFVEGSKFYVFNDLMKNVRSATDVERVLLDNQPIVNKMKALYGDEPTQEMLDAVSKQIIKIKTAERVSGAFGMGKLADVDTPSHVTAKQALDVGIVTGAPPGVTSKAAGAGALGRLISGDMAEAMTPAADLFAAKTLTASGNESALSYQRLLDMLQRAAPPSAGGQMAAGAAGAVAGGELGDAFIAGQQ